MRTARLKAIKKMLRRLEGLRFRAPYRALADPEFLHSYAKSQMPMSHLRSVLGPVNLWISSCGYRRYKELDPEEKRIIGQVDIKKCAHEKYTHECIRDMVAEGNRNRYLACVSIKEREIKRMKNVPVVYFRGGSLQVEIGESTLSEMDSADTSPALTRKEKERLEKMFGK
jgi:rRNA-processing protein FCF1